MNIIHIDVQVVVWPCDYLGPFHVAKAFRTDRIPDVRCLTPSGLDLPVMHFVPPKHKNKFKIMFLKIHVFPSFWILQLLWIQKFRKTAKSNC